MAIKMYLFSGKSCLLLLLTEIVTGNHVTGVGPDKRSSNSNSSSALLLLCTAPPLRCSFVLVCLAAFLLVSHTAPLRALVLFFLHSSPWCFAHLSLKLLPLLLSLLLFLSLLLLLLMLFWPCPFLCALRFPDAPLRAPSPRVCGLPRYPVFPRSRLSSGVLELARCCGGLN